MNAAAAAHEEDLGLVVAAGRVMERELQAARRERSRVGPRGRGPAPEASALDDGVSTPLIRAAGGVLWRPTTSATEPSVEVAVVHRPRYDDWSLPKGKLAPGEPEVEARSARCSRKPGFGSGSAGRWARHAT